MRSRVVLHVVVFVLAEAQLRNRSSGSYQDLLLSCANLKVPVSQGQPGLQPQCEHGLVASLLSENHDKPRDEGSGRANRRELIVYNEKAQKRKDGDVVPQRTSTRAINTLRRFSVFSCTRKDTQLLTVLLNFSRTAKISPKAMVHVNAVVPTGLVNIHDMCEESKSTRRLKRSKHSENLKQTTKKDLFEPQALPWTALWVLQEVRPEDGVFQRPVRSGDPQFSRLKKRNSEDDDDLALVPWQTLWLLQGDSTKWSYPGQILRFGTGVKDLEKNEWLHPLPEESLGNCPVRFRPLLDPYRWLPRVLVEAECVCEGSPCALRGLHVCVTVYAARSLYSLRGGRRRILIAVGCLCAIRKSRLATAITPNTVD